MAVVDISIGKRVFQLACDSGEEEHLKKLSEEVNAKINLLSESTSGNNDTLLLVMASLMLQDELNELKFSSENNVNSEEHKRDVNNAITEAITKISEYIEKIAKQIEKG